MQATICELNQNIKSILVIQRAIDELQEKNRAKEAKHEEVEEKE